MEPSAFARGLLAINLHTSEQSNSIGDAHSSANSMQKVGRPASISSTWIKRKLSRANAQVNASLQYERLSQVAVGARCSATVRIAAVTGRAAACNIALFGRSTLVSGMPPSRHSAQSVAAGLNPFSRGNGRMPSCRHHRLRASRCFSPGRSRQDARFQSG